MRTWLQKLLSFCSGITTTVQTPEQIGMCQLEKLQRKWLAEKVNQPPPASEDELMSFQATYNVRLPQDMADYFWTLNGTGEDCDQDLFQFHPLSDVKKLIDQDKEYKNDLKSILASSPEYNHCYIFANYMINSYQYAITLHPDLVAANQVFIIYSTDEEPWKVADSFSEFIDLYLADSPRLHFGE